VSLSTTAPLLGQQVTATFSCGDDNSGLAACGANVFAPAGTPLKGPLSVGPSQVSFNAPSVTGPQTYSVTATDIAGNSFVASVNYTVVDQPADLAILAVAKSTVKAGNNLTFGMGAINIGPNAASNVTITNTIPAGTTFVSAFFAKVSCSVSGCNIPSTGTACSPGLVGNQVVCSNIGSLGLIKNLTGVGVAIVVNVPLSLKGTKITDTATISTSNRDPKPVNNTSTASTLVQ
jgi:uncharacterized repeat protein (TIGR01451 family)